MSISIVDAGILTETSHQKRKSAHDEEKQGAIEPYEILHDSLADDAVRAMLLSEVLCFGGTCR